jgi:hypothetical protein
MLTHVKGDGDASLDEIKEEFPDSEDCGDTIKIPVSGEDIDYDEAQEKDEYGLPESYADGLNRKKEKMIERINQMRGNPVVMSLKRSPSPDDLVDVELETFQSIFEKNSSGGLGRHMGSKRCGCFG